MYYNDDFLDDVSIYDDEFDDFPDDHDVFNIRRAIVLEDDVVYRDHLWSWDTDLPAY